MNGRPCNSGRGFFQPRLVAAWLVVLAAGMFLATPSLRADEAASLFAQGNQRYTQGDYEGAIRAYESILERGFESWQVYYNLGNAYYKRGEIGKAILNFERARRLNPRDEDIRHNLDLANLKVVDRINAIPEFFFVRWLKFLARLLPLATLGWLALGFYGVAASLWIVRLFARGKLRSTLTAVLIPAVAAWIALLTLAAYRFYIDRADTYAIVLVEKVDARSAPEQDGTEVFAIHEGVKVRIDRQENQWAKIRLADGKVGWIPLSAVGRI